jgi:hypothetical protein
VTTSGDFHVALDIDSTNRAWQRFTDVVGEHLDVDTWTRDDGRPVLATLTDIVSGGSFTVGVFESCEMRERAPRRVPSASRVSPATIMGPP